MFKIKTIYQLEDQVKSSDPPMSWFVVDFIEMLQNNEDSTKINLQPLQRELVIVEDLD